MRREWIEISAGVHLNDRCRGLPPCGGSGLKLHSFCVRLIPTVRSPSMRREWIEIHILEKTFLSLHGLPPCGGSGLKYAASHMRFHISGSPSMRREWIEITLRPDTVR